MWMDNRGKCANLEKNESGIHMRVCLEVLNLQQQQNTVDFYTTVMYKYIDDLFSHLSCLKN